MLEYHGNFEVIGKSELYKQWKIQSRMSTIMMNVTRSHGTKLWMATFIFIIFALFTLAVGALGYERGLGLTLSQSSKEVGEDGYSLYTSPLRLTPRGDFSYPPQKNLQYPTCSIFGGIDVAGGVETALIDTAFLSGQVIYQDPESFQGAIDLWFGQGVGRLDRRVTSAYRETLMEQKTNKQVNYDIFSFREDRLAVVVVRGSWTAWEYLISAQYWSPVALMQLFQLFLPVGEAFNPILDKILGGMSFVKSKKLREIALNEQTTGLVNYMRDTAGYKGLISITGHSLGGGIAMITGAETNIPTVAISAPNIIFSRRFFNPPLDLNRINTMLLNVIPQGDIVPLIDKPGLLTQHIACRSNNFLECHTGQRTLCELLYKCGSYNRPPPCECAVKFGYPEPEQISGFNQTFSEICRASR